MSSVTLEGITKSFGSNTVLERISLAVADGEFLTLLGPSGSGKTTLLRIIAGLIMPDAGMVLFGSRTVTRLPPNKRNVAMVFQDYALYPNMRVRENIGFCLKLRRTPRNEIAQRVEGVSRTLGIEAFLHRWPQELSGGQKQRVALGRAMVRQPDVFLLDEPLSNLDAQLRIAMRAELQKIHRRFGMTMIHVTHDQEEAMSVSQRIALVNHGRVEQIASPQELYHSPANVFVARFIGTPAINLFPCRLVERGGRWHLEGRSLSLTVPNAELAPLQSSSEILLGIRPEDLSLAADPSGCLLHGEITVIEQLGKEAVIYLTTRQGEEVIVRTVPNFSLRVGQRVSGIVRQENLYFFDRDSGVALRGRSAGAL